MINLNLKLATRNGKSFTIQNPVNILNFIKMGLLYAKSLIKMESSIS